MNSSFILFYFILFFTLLRVVPKLKQKRFPFLYTMGTSTVSILTLCLLCGILHGIMCTSDKARQFSKKTGVLYQSPYSEPELTSCLGRRCTGISCARACEKEAGCIVFSHNEAKAKCILSRRPDNDSANYEISHSEWDAYYTGNCTGGLLSVNSKLVTETGTHTHQVSLSDTFLQGGRML